MQQFTTEQFQEVMRIRGIRSRVRKEVRFSPLAYNWAETEIAFIGDRSRAKGVLLLQPYDDLLLIEAELSSGLVDPSGRTRPVTCDFCMTWQPGGNAASLLLKLSAHHSITYLCCADMACSRHVRSLTSEAIRSRSQLREDMTSEQRITRLKARMLQIMTNIKEKL